VPGPVCSSILVSDPVAPRRVELERLLDEAAAELETLTRDYMDRHGKAHCGGAGENASGQGR
jgi:hypothetical protein